MRLPPLIALAAAACMETPTLQCDGVIHYVEVAGAVCLDGSPTGFEYVCHPGDEMRPLVVILDGGGACWTGDLCDCQPDADGLCTGPNASIVINHYGKAQSLDGKAAGELVGSALYSGPTSPFDGWNLFRIPYCTGDSHMGDAEAQLTTGDGKTYTAHFKGHRDVTLFIEQARSLFPTPSKVAVTGTSAGGHGVDCNLDQFRVAWASTRMYALNIAGVPFEPSHAPDTDDATRTWGAWQPGTFGGLTARTCPIEAPSGTTAWGLPLVELYNRLHFPEVKKGITADYSDGTMQAFACLLGAPPDADETCASAIDGILNDAADHYIGSTDLAYRVYFHDGTCHDRDADDEADGPGCGYDSMVQGGVKLSDWVNQMMRDDPSWTNVR